MKRLICAFAITCVVSFPAAAGNIPTDGITGSTPVPTETMEPGEIPTSGLSYEIADNAIDLIQMLIGVGI